jgi:RNA polymerase sigma factor (sigma-70 family)
VAVHRTVHDRTVENQCDTALVLRACDWDEAAQAELYHKYHDQFLTWIRRWLRHKEWATDFADAAIAQLFEVLPQYKPELSSFRTWAYRVAYTGVIKYIRDLHTERDDVSADDLFLEFLPALTGPEQDYAARRLREEVANLVPEQRAAVGGPLDGLTDVELSALLSIPKRRVCYRRRQALAELRKRLIDVARTWIRPKGRFLGYKDIGTNDA